MPGRVRENAGELPKFTGNLLIMRLRKGALFFLFCTVICSKAFPQKYNFISYNTDEGLAQSQVFSLTQSEDRQLWMSTFTGMSRFDGKTFYNYSVADGLAANFVLHFVVDHQQTAWAITNAALNSIEGNKISTFPLPQTVTGNRARLAVTEDNILWCLINGDLYSFIHHQFIKKEIKGIPDHALLSLIKGEKQRIYLMTPHRVLYRYQSGEWSPFAALHLPDSTERIFNIYVDSLDHTWVLTQNELLLKNPLSSEMQSLFRLKDPQVIFYCLTKDRSGNFWVGSKKGVYKIRPDGSYLHFDGSNGFINYFVNDIITDAEGNIWLGTNGEGLMKYGGGIFTAFENAGNTTSAEIMVVTSNRRGDLLFGNRGNDFCIYDGKVKKYPFRNTALQDYDITCALAERNGVVWIGTTGGGLWKYEKGVASPSAFTRGTVSRIYDDGDKILFFTSEGLMVAENGIPVRRPGIKEAPYSVLSIGKDSLLFSRHDGLLFLKDTLRIKVSFPSALQKTAVSGFEKRKTKVFIGTIGSGIFIWDLATGQFEQITTAKGLASNIIYSLKFDNSDRLWVGSGKGVSRLSSTDEFHTRIVRNYGKEQGFKGMECNSEAITVLPDNTVWFGTSRGLYCYHPEEDRENSTPPRLALRSVNLVKNHISFEFRAISYSRSNIHYSYFLQGLENAYSAPELTEFVAYPSLPPGKYVFKLKATDEGGKQLGELLTYPFSVEPEFYQTLWFRLLLLLAASGMIYMIYSIRRKFSRRQQQLIAAVRAEEQRKIRKKTARDFHDEMGNKLARITILSDILKAKVPANEEMLGIANKIQENVSSLHQGTKDIIWSLNPDNDNLYFLLKHINQLGMDLFTDAGIEFFEIWLDEGFRNYHLPMDHARNVIMISKEIFTNIFKHAQSSKVIASAAIMDINTIRLDIADDGKGFETKGSTGGNGLVNMQQRANTLHADLEIRSVPGKGTSVSLTFTIPPGGE